MSLEFIIYILNIYYEYNMTETSAASQSTLDITTPHVLYIIRTIKSIQKRIMDPDMRNQEEIWVYDQMTREFCEFCDCHKEIFRRVVRGEDLSIVAGALYYEDRMCRGLLTKEKLSDDLHTKFLPPDLKLEADKRISEMRANGEI